MVDLCVVAPTPACNEHPDPRFQPCASGEKKARPSRASAPRRRAADVQTPSCIRSSSIITHDAIEYLGTRPVSSLSRRADAKTRAGAASLQRDKWIWRRFSTGLVAHLLLDADGVDGGGSLGDDGGAAGGARGALRDARGEGNLAGLGKSGHVSGLGVTMTAVAIRPHRKNPRMFEDKMRAAGSTNEL